MTTLTPPRADSEQPAAPTPRTRERIFRRRGSGDFSKPTLGG
ncbi:carbohydrate ABC transporter permease, partial [Salmonella enterica subsp. enterica serovar Haifa]|nr:carbohydrate ABC transporter permease [Salmonella enterica subsp. enterica serovar Haifa]